MATQLEDLNVLQRAEKISDLLWKHIIRWDPFARDSVGLQIVRAADSIGANIAEAIGRFDYEEKIQFLYNARGSLFETKYWLNRTQTRGLLTDSTARDLSSDLTTAAKQLNAFTRDLKNQHYKKPDQSNTIREKAVEYQSDDPDFEPLFSPDELIWLLDVKTDAIPPNPQSLTQKLALE